MTDQSIQQDAICYQWFKQRLILNVSKPSISQRSQIKEDTVEPSVLPEILFCKYALRWLAYTDKPSGPGVELRTSGGLAARQAMRTAAQCLTTAPRGHAGGLLTFQDIKFTLVNRRADVEHFGFISSKSDHFGGRTHVRTHTQTVW